jgi:F420-dependent methylenetetrahydromethanopterin dehydrogenase
LRGRGRADDRADQPARDRHEIELVVVMHPLLARRRWIKATVMRPVIPGIVMLAGPNPIAPAPAVARAGWGRGGGAWL